MHKYDYIIYWLYEIWNTSNLKVLFKNIYINFNITLLYILSIFNFKLNYINHAFISILNESFAVNLFCNYKYKQ